MCRHLTMRAPAFFIVALNACLLHCQVLPPERQYQWSKAGCGPEIAYLDTVRLEEYGLTGDGVFVNDDILQDAISRIGGRPAVMIVPSGTFRFTRGIALSSNMKIAGQGHRNTRLVFDNRGAGHLFVVSGRIVKDRTRITDEINKGDSTITIADGSAVAEGDYVILCDNDAEKVTSEWAGNTTGQICRVKGITGLRVELNSGLRRDYKLSDSAYLQRVLPAENIVIENLAIERVDSTPQQTSGIFFNYAVDCRVKCITSARANFAHVDIRNSSRITIEGSYFESAFSYGGGGKAYGVMIQSASGECLVYNNIFRRLRHSMILQSGANGNVIAYNYSMDPYWTEVTLPSNSAGDACLHGNYPYANLFEGNICQNVVIDNTHGINGPGNTFLRNRAELYGFVMNANPASNRQNFIGNETTNSDFLKGLYLLFGADHFEYCNNIGGTITPPGPDMLEDGSYFLSAPPPWYDSNSSFPPIGRPNNLNEHAIEAKKRHSEGKLTACDDSPTGMRPFRSENAIHISPSPAGAYIEIRYSGRSLFRPGHDAIRIYDALGRCMLTSDRAASQIQRIDISALRPGAHYVSIEDGCYRISVIR